MDDLGSVIIVMLIGAAFGVLVSLAIADSMWKAETVERGLAIYCPQDGSWAWIEECQK
jgi:hypothetical protein